MVADSATPISAALLGAISAGVVELCRNLSQAGKRGWVVGGSVRDLLVGSAPKDWDVATDARPEQVKKIFRRVIPTGIQHGTVTVLLGGHSYEVTTLRVDGAYGDGRHPDEVQLTEDLAGDLARRDFTFNAIAIDPLAATLIDPFGGRADLERKLVRAVGEAEQRFTEDGLRVLRAARFAATLGCRIEAGTLAAMASRRALDTLAKVSAERVRDEWLKAMAAPQPSVAFDIMRETGILALLCPELLDLWGCEQNRWHAFDVWTHTMRAVDACPPDPVLRLAALLHDVGKPASREHSDKTDDYTFHGHEIIGARLADAITRRLKLSNDDRARTVAIVRHHLVCYSPDWSDAAVRRWLRRVEPERAPDLYAMARADAQAKGRPADAELRAIDELGARVERLLAEGAALGARDLAIDGHLLMTELDLSPGPLVGVILRALVDLVVDEPAANQPERLLAEARRIADASERHPS